MTDFLQSQMDYIYFFMGAVFILLLPVCQVLHRVFPRVLPWLWLGLFGLCYGAYKWWHLLIVASGQTFLLEVVHYALLIASLALLLEFARRAAAVRGQSGPRPWMAPAFLGLAGLGVFWGMEGLHLSCSLVLGLAAGPWAGWELYQAGGDTFTRNRVLLVAAAALMVFSLAGSAPCASCWFLASTPFHHHHLLFLGTVNLWLELAGEAAALGLLLSLLSMALVRLEARWSRRLLLGGMAGLVLLSGLGWLFTQYLGSEALEDLKQHQTQEARFIMQTLGDQLLETQRIAELLSGALSVRDSLTSPTPDSLWEADRHLDRYSRILHPVCYLMDVRGLTVASSNRDQPDSFMGKSYAMRPYFQEAIQGTPGRYFALGLTSGERGFYASHPVQDGQGRIIGVAVVKRSVSAVEQILCGQHPTFFIDPHGIVFLSSRSDLLLKSLWPLPPAVAESLAASRQFGDGPFDAILPYRPQPGATVILDGNRSLFGSFPLENLGWSIVSLASLAPVALARLMGILATMFLGTLLIGIVGILYLREEAADRISRSARKFRELYEGMPDGSAAVNMAGMIIECNPAFSQMLGYTPEELRELTDKDITPEKWRPLEEKILADQVMIRGYSDLYQKEYRRRDGSLFPVELRTFLRQDDQGRPAGMWAIVQDITARRQAEEKIQHSLSLLQATLDSTADGILVVDRQGRKVGYNRNFMEIWGIPETVMTTRESGKVRSFVKDQFPNPEQFLARIQEIYAQPEAESFDLLEAIDGRVIERYSRPQFLGEEIVGRVWSFRDITAKKQMEKREEQLNLLRGELLRSGSLSEKLKLITDSVVAIFAADFCRIWLVKPGDRCDAGCFHAGMAEGIHACLHRDHCLHLMASSGRYTHINSPLHGRIPLGAYKIGQLGEGDESKLVTNEVQTDDRIHDRQWAKNLGVTAFAGYRLVSEDLRSIGVMALFSTRAITTEEEASLQGVANTASQVTQMAAADEALRESEAMFRTLVTSSPAQVYQGYADWSVDFFDEGIQEITGYPVQDFNSRKMKWWDIILPEDREKVRAAFVQALKTDHSFMREYRIRHRDGRIFWVRDRGRILCREDGAIDYVSGVFSDITAQKQLEQELEHLRHQQELILTAAGEGIFGLDEACRVIFVNPAALEMTGYQLEELLGRAMHGLIHHTRADGTPHPMEECPVHATLQSGLAHRAEDDLFWRKDGASFPVEYVATPVMEEGRTVGTVVVFKDITQRKQAQNDLNLANLQLQTLVKDYGRRNREISLINSLAEMLQACQGEPEAYPVIARFAQELFQAEAGGLYILDFDKDVLAPVASWGADLQGEETFSAFDCWGLRRNRTYLLPDGERGVKCLHLAGAAVTSSICIPLTSQDGNLGILHFRNLPYIFSGALEFSEEGIGPLQQLAATMADHIGLALANLRLRETLRRQAIRDALTGLFNRRYLEETLERELRRAKRKDTPLGIIMLDLDRFKQFNDRYGHEAGDHLLRTLGDFLRSHIRAGDIACRYGGEEFVLILPESDAAVTLKRAEELRQGVEALPVFYRGQQLGITISLGVAVCPLHGDSGETLLRAADQALYAAKEQGRNRVVAA